MTKIIFKKAVCGALVFLLSFFLRGCRNPVRSPLSYLMDQFEAYPMTTIWMSDHPKINLYMNGKHGDLVTKDGEYITFRVEYSYGTYFSAVLPGQAHEKLFDFDGAFRANGFVLRLSEDDVGKVFDSSVKKIELQRKDAEDTGFLRDSKLICEEPELYMELTERIDPIASDGFQGVITTKENKQIFFGTQISPFEHEDGLGVRLNLYEGYYLDGRFRMGYPPDGTDSAEREEQKPFLRAELMMDHGKYRFRISDDDIGTVFDESVSEFALMPATEEQEKDLLDMYVHSEQFTGVPDSSD